MPSAAAKRRTPQQIAATASQPLPAAAAEAASQSLPSAAAKRRTSQQIAADNKGQEEQEQEEEQEQDEEQVQEEPEQEQEQPEQEQEGQEEEEQYQYQEQDQEEEEEEEEEEVLSQFNKLLMEFAGELQLIEINHKVSKTAGNRFWDSAMKFLPVLFQAHERENITKKIPKFSHLRRQLYKKHVPKITMTFGYINKNTGDLVKTSGTKTPVAQFPPSTYRMAYETASVSTADIVAIHEKGFFLTINKSLFLAFSAVVLPAETP